MSDLTQVLSSRQSTTRPACIDAPPGTMFPSATGRPKKGDRLKAYRPALAYCAVCDHHEACQAEWEAAGRPEHGVWFGTVPGQRNNLTRRRDLGNETMRWLRANGPSSAQQIHDGLGGVNGGVNAVYSVVRRLRVAGHITVSDTTPTTYAVKGL